MEVVHLRLNHTVDFWIVVRIVVVYVDDCHAAVLALGAEWIVGVSETIDAFGWDEH